MNIARMWRGMRVVVLVALALALGGAQPPQPTTHPEENQASANFNSSTTRIVDAINHIAPEKDEGCEDRTDKRSSDLCAQWKAADAARRAASATWFAVILSFIGTLFLAFTFLDQRNVSRAELRPYLFIEKFDIWERSTNVFEVTVWFKNFGRTPARNIQAQFKSYAAETTDDLRDFDDSGAMELSTAAPDHARRAYWPLIFTDEEWASPPWACFGIYRIKYTYTDDAGNRFDEAFDYYAEQADLQSGKEPVFFLLTDWIRGRHAQHREAQPNLFSAETIARIRSRNLAALEDERAYAEAEAEAEYEKPPPAKRAAPAKKRASPTKPKPKTRKS